MSGQIKLACCVFLLGVIGFTFGTRTAAADPETTPRQIFEKRIMPIFKSPNPSSCTQCHLSGVDLQKYIIPSTEGKTDGHEKTFLSLRDQGLIDLENPAKSKILGFIQKREKGGDNGTAMVLEKVRQVELDAFAEWIKESCKDDALRNAPKLKPEELARPNQDPEVIRYTRKDRLLASFEKNIWSMRFRCISCHGEDESKQANAHVEKYGQRVSWIKKEGAKATMNYLISTKKLIDVKNPEKSMLLQKATGEVAHVGGGKLKKTVHLHPKQVDEGDLGYKGFRRWLEDYARVVNGEYKDIAGLPKKKENFNEYGTEIRLGFTNVPKTWVNHLVLINVYVWDESKRDWETNPVATCDGIPSQNHTAREDGMYLNLIAEKGSERDRLWKGKDEVPALPGSRHLIKVYVDRSDRIKKDWKQNMTDEDYVGQMELNGELPLEALPAEVERIGRLIQDLDHHDFEVREKASAELETMGPAVPALRQALDRSASVELRQRVGRILEKLMEKFNPAKIDARKVK